MSSYTKSVAKFYRYRTPYHPKFIEKIVSEVALKRVDVPLDLLCGRGEIASQLSNYCDLVVAVDGSISMLEEAIHKNNIQYIQSDVNKLEFLDIFKFQKFRHCFVGRGIHWIDESSLINIKNLLGVDSWFVTMESGFCISNLWVKKYKEIIREIAKQPSIGYDWVSKEKMFRSGFSFLKPIGFGFDMKINIDYLYFNSMSLATTAKYLIDIDGRIVKEAIRAGLSDFLQEDGTLMANISNTARIYR